MKEHLKELKIGGRPMSKNELKIIELQQENKHLNLQLDQALKDYEELLIKIDKAISYIYILKNNVKDFETEYKEDMLNMLDDIGNILGGDSDGM